MASNSTDDPEWDLQFSTSMPDYDWNETMYLYDWAELAPPLVVYTLTLLLGLAGNSLIILTTLRFRRMQSTTNVFLSSLALADLLLIIVCIPVKLAKLFSYTWAMGFFTCKFAHYIQNVSAICSVLTLTAMSIERYYAIIHPMRVRYLCSLSQAKRICMALWLAAFILALPILWVHILMPVGQRVPAFWCVRDWENPTLWRLHELYCLLLILVLPTAVMVFTYSVVCWEVWHVMLMRYHMTSGQGLSPSKPHESVPLSKKQRHVGIRTDKKALKLEEDSHTVKQVIKMLVAVVVIFVVCWAPLLIDNLLTAYGVLKPTRMDGLKHMLTAFHLMAAFNSCVNPIVYGFMSRNFRESFREAICKCSCCGWFKGPRRPIRQASCNTRTTSLRLADTSYGRSGGTY